jgi:MFS family permease
MQVIGSDIAPADARGRFFGVWRLIGEIGQVLSPIVFALLAEGPGYGASFLFLACTAFGSALVLATRIKETLRKEPSVIVATAEASAPSSGR